MRRTLKRLDLTAKTLYAVVGPGSAFAGSLFEITLAADRSYMLDDREHPTAIQLDEMQFGSFPMSNGLTRLPDAVPGRADAGRSPA